jgi:hypothetical protein
MAASATGASNRGDRCLELWRLDKRPALSGVVINCTAVPLSTTGNPPYSFPPYWSPYAAAHRSRCGRGDAPDCRDCGGLVKARPRRVTKRLRLLERAIAPRTDECHRSGSTRYGTATWLPLSVRSASIVSPGSVAAISLISSYVDSWLYFLRLWSFGAPLRSPGRARCHRSVSLARVMGPPFGQGLGTTCLAQWG